MEMALLHPDRVDYPGAIDWTKTDMVPIGVVDLNDDDTWVPLAIVQEGRVRRIVAIVDGEQVDLDIDEAGPALYDALETTCSDLFGYAWNAALQYVFGINRRTLQRDRVVKYLLPGGILTRVSYIASADDANELAQMIQAIARYDKRFEDRETVMRYVADAIAMYYDKNEYPNGFRVGP